MPSLTATLNVKPGLPGNISKDLSTFLSFTKYKLNDWLPNSPGGDDGHARVRGDEVRLLVSDTEQAVEGGVLHAGDAGADVPGVGSSG